MSTLETFFGAARRRLGYPVPVYVAGPFSASTRDGVDANIAAADALGQRIAALGAYPVVPHNNTAHPAYESLQPYQYWIDATLWLARQCPLMALVDGWECSSGARGELMQHGYLPVVDVVGDRVLRCSACSHTTDRGVASWDVLTIEGAIAAIEVRR